MSSPSTDPPRHVSKADYERLATFRYALRRFLRFSEDAATQAGLTPQQHQALLAIQGMPDRDYATIGELAERLQIRPNTAVELAARLGQEGLLQRETSAEDKRAVHLRLTPEGLEKLRLLSSAHQNELARIGPVLARALNAAIWTAKT